MPMKKLNQIPLLIVFLILNNLVYKVVTKGGRFGGSGRGPRLPGASRYNTLIQSSSFIDKSVSNKPKWYDYGKGLIAFNIMYNLAASINFNETVLDEQPSYQTENNCVNYEDFNGTVFGFFKCPLPGFEANDQFCCGSFDDKTQFCCKFLDDKGRRSAVLYSTLGFMVFLLIVGLIIKRVYRRLRIELESFYNNDIYLKFMA